MSFFDLCHGRIEQSQLTVELLFCQCPCCSFCKESEPSSVDRRRGMILFEACQRKREQLQRARSSLTIDISVSLQMLAQSVVCPFDCVRSRISSKLMLCIRELFAMVRAGKARISIAGWAT